MNKRILMTDMEVEDMMQRIDEGIRLAHQRLVQRAKHDGLSLVVTRNGKLMEVNAADF